MLFTEGLSKVDHESKGNEGGYLLRAWRITPGSPGESRLVEPMGFINWKDDTKKLYVEQDAAKANTFLISDGTEKFVGKIGIRGNSGGKPIAIVEGDEYKSLVMSDDVIDFWFDYIPTYGVTEQVYILTAANNAEKLGLIGDYFAIFGDGVYAFSVCDNFVPAQLV